MNEILALERIGVSIQIYAITNPKEPIVQPDTRQVRARVRYLEQAEKRPAWQIALEQFVALFLFGAHYLAALIFVLAHPSIDRGYTMSSRKICFLQAVYLARMLARERRLTGKTIRHLHAHFAHDPTLVAQLVSRMTGIPFSFTAHARDLYQVDPHLLARRIHEASTVITCCHTNLDYLRQLAPDAKQKYRLIYHGVNLSRFQPAVQPVRREVPLIISAGRMIEKKGFLDLLEALAIVHHAGIPFRCEIYGEGPLQGSIEQAIQKHGLDGLVTLPGSRTQQELAKIIQQADVFALTPLVTGDGDRDGIPNVLVEAMAVGLPVISTAVAGIPELLLHKQNGLLHQPRDIEGIATGLTELLTNEPIRRQYGAAAQRWVSDQFDVNHAAVKLHSLYFREPAAFRGEFASYAPKQPD